MMIDQWHSSLTPAQAEYVDQHCRSESDAFSQLCGATPLVVAFDNQRVEFATREGAR